MKAYAARLKDPQIKPRQCRRAQINKAGQCPRVGNSKIMAGEKSDLPAAIKKVLEVFLKKSNSTFENESDSDVGTIASIQMGQKMGQQRVSTSANKMSR
jgi:hypothetical protein